MADNESIIPVCADADVAYPVTGMIYDSSVIPVCPNTEVTYAPQSDVVIQSRSVIPAVADSEKETAPLSYVYSEPVTEGELRAWIYLDGVDVSSYLDGELSVKGAESASTIASFGLVFGPTVEPGQDAWVVVYDGSKLEALFIGELYSVKPQPDNGTIVCKATNNLQGKIRELPEEELLQLIPGFFHKEISRTDGDQWEFAQELLETVPMEIHVDHSGSLVSVDWRAKAVADVEITNATRYAGTLRGEVAKSSAIVNRNRITLQHKFKRRKLRTINCGWTHPNYSNMRAYMEHSWPLPNKAAVRGALDGCGWEYSSVSFTPPWHHYRLGEYYVYCDYNGGTSAGGMILQWHEDLLIGFGAALRKTWDQMFINNYVLDVRSNASIAALGERAVEEQWGISEEYEEQVRDEVSGRGLVVDTSSGSQSRGSVVTTGGVEGQEVKLEYGNELENGDQYYDDISATTDLEGGKNTAVNRAITEILASHRAHSEFFEVPFSHDNKLENTTKLVGDVTCKGKNRSLTHKINPSAGYARTIIEVAISGYEGQGVDTPDPLEQMIPPVNDPLTVSDNISLRTIIGGDYSTPPRPDSGLSAVYSDYEWTNEYPAAASEAPEINMYGKSVEIHAPEIGAADVDDREQTIQQTIVVDVPVDEYALNYSGGCP